MESLEKQNVGENIKKMAVIIKKININREEFTSTIYDSKLHLYRKVLYTNIKPLYCESCFELVPLFAPNNECPLIKPIYNYIFNNDTLINVCFDLLFTTVPVSKIIIPYLSLKFNCRKGITFCQSCLSISQNTIYEDNFIRRIYYYQDYLKYLCQKAIEQINATLFEDFIKREIIKLIKLIEELTTFEYNDMKKLKYTFDI